MILEKKWKDKIIVVGLSGGVDSAVAAWLLRESGADVRTVFMKNWDDSAKNAACHDKEDLISAAAVAETLGLDFEVIHFIETYRRLVFEPFLRELQRGRTPNPDVLCNSHIKFSAFHDYAQQQGAVAVATGHYARITNYRNAWQLCKGEDGAKDQTYFLHRLRSDQLARSIFPLGGMHKSTVRQIAHAQGLKNWSRKDSTGICFIGEVAFKSFLLRYLPKTPGDIVDEKGHIFGQHDGLPFYTIGQRRGLHIGGADGPWFVANKDLTSNTLQVVAGSSHPLLFRQQVEIEDVHWISGQPPPTQWVYAARLRHQQQPASCTLTRATDRWATVVFAQPQRAPTPGQYAVIYDGNHCLGGGVIV